MKQSVYEQKEVKELIAPNANHGFWARQKRNSMIYLKWGLLGLLLIAVIMPSLGIKSSDIKEVDNLMTMEELGYNQTETLNTAIVTPLKDITNEIGIVYQMNINDPTVRPGEYFFVTLNISKLDMIENVDLVLKKIWFIKSTIWKNNSRMLD